MQFVSTRGRAPALSFSDAILSGLARDGGLLVPQAWPQFDARTIAGFATARYQDVALAVLEPFLAGEVDDLSRVAGMIDDAYAGFRHPSVTPLGEIEPGHYLLELFHGPTLAFKDVALQLLARLMDHILADRGTRLTLIGATSGDTGSAAIEAFRGRDNVDIFILHPQDRTSEVQRRQMTTVADANVHNLAVRGTFDDCQAIVKALFNDQRFRDEVSLSGVNSINWGRILGQIVYYFKAAAQLGAPARAVSFCVPTGNFGDVFAGYAAKRMGLPVQQLVIATNENDILARTLETGRYQTAGVVRTSSPSMDIQVSSNFERLLYDAFGNDGEAVSRAMAGLSQSGGFEIGEPGMTIIRSSFSAGRATGAEAAATIADVEAGSGQLIDPHTAVAVSVARRMRVADVPMVTLATAHPAKFPDAVKAATGIEPALPVWLADLYEREERFTVLDNDAGEVARFIRARTRAAEEVR
jgi:threonine synthase